MRSTLTGPAGVVRNPRRTADHTPHVKVAPIRTKSGCEYSSTLLCLFLGEPRLTPIFTEFRSACCSLFPNLRFWSTYSLVNIAQILLAHQLCYPTRLDMSSQTQAL